MCVHEHLIRRLQRSLDEVSSAATKRWWEAYLKGAIPFRGAGIPQIRSVLALWRAENGIDRWPVSDQFGLALLLFDQPMAEDKLAGILRDLSRHDPAAVTAFVEAHLQHFSAEALKNSLRYAVNTERQRYLNRRKAARKSPATDGA